MQKNGNWMPAGAMMRLPKNMTSRRQFFFDENGPAHSYSVYYKYAPVEKRPITIHQEEAGLLNSSLGNVVKMEDGTYRAYGDARSMDQHFKGIMVWQSDNLTEWHPLYLDQVKRDGKETNALYIEGLPGDQSAVAGPNIVKRRDGGWMMYFWKHKDGHFRYTIAESEDGLHWRVPDFEKPALFHPADGGLLKAAAGLDVEEFVKQDLPMSEILRRKSLWTNDALSIYYNEHLDRYEYYGVWLHPAIADRRVDVDNAPGLHRLIARRVSDDGKNWSDAELLIWPDGRDPWDLQFYFLGVQWYDDFMLGSLGYYRVEEGQQSMDTDLCFSRDGYRWHRPIRGGWIPRSEKDSGEMDTIGIYAGGPWYDMGDKFLTYYFATPHQHNDKVFEFAMNGAVFDKNRLVGVAAGDVTGGFMSEPFFPSKTEVTIDADIKGWLKAELCDAFGRKISGFQLKDSIAVTGNSQKHILKWKNAEIGSHVYECLRLRFELKNGVVYNIAY